MSFIGKFVMVVGVGCLFSATIKAADTDSGNPYNAVVVRNMFGLMPIPTNPPPPPPSDPPPKITPNGIMNLLGDLQVLFKVTVPPKPGQPPHDESYVLSEGERQDDIEVVKIDEKAAMITFNNHGITQELALANAPNVSTPAPSFGGSNPNMPMRPMGGRFGGGGGAINHVFGAARGGPPISPSSGPGGPGYGNNNGSQSENNGLSVESQIIAIEAQRQQYQSEGNPIANIMPKTVLTDQLNNEGGEGQPAGPAPGPP